jgi:hypothetical protein
MPTHKLSYSVSVPHTLVGVDGAGSCYQVDVNDEGLLAVRCYQWNTDTLAWEAEVKPAA